MNKIESSHKIDERVSNVMIEFISAYKSLSDDLAIELNKKITEFTNEEVRLIKSISMLDHLLDSGHEVLLEFADDCLRDEIKFLFGAGERARILCEKTNTSIVTKCQCNKKNE